MRCPKCGYSLPEDSLFCQYCGVSLAASRHPGPPADEQGAASPIPIPADAPVRIFSAGVPAAASAGASLDTSPSPSADTSPDTPADNSSDSSAGTSSDAPSAAPSDTSVTRPVDRSGETPPPGAVRAEARRGAARGARKQVHCKKCGGVIDSRTKRCSGCGKQYFRAKAVIPLLVCCVLLVSSLSLNGVQYLRGRQSAQALAAQAEALDAAQAAEAESPQATKVEALEKEIADLNSTIANQKSTILSQADRLALFKEELESFHFLSQELSSGNIGYASDKFRASEGVIVVSLQDHSRKFTLTASRPSIGAVSVDYSDCIQSTPQNSGVWPTSMKVTVVRRYVASVTFDSSTWTTSTEVTIHPQEVGVTAVTFSNDANSQTFKVIIIVTD